LGATGTGRQHAHEHEGHDAQHDLLDMLLDRVDAFELHRFILSSSESFFAS
jgi:hypothetical protein